MGREYKFRVWDILGKRMLQWGDIFDLPAWEIFPGTPEQRAFNVMQYTGLDDVEETEIYDGHLCTDDGVSVLQVLWLDSHHQWGVKVISGSGTLSIGLEFPLWHWDNCKQNGYRQLKIIGDVYTNPELLEV
ncbi:hypothetical protein KDC22_14355 [Paenibacillus tritici]|uniref:YopX family protein n=1 Tax=Paenibacillus tritici TaxID=1873425 RepID=UPI001BAAFAFC|nr:YopX family protein [Paenibacillus tritici]QUL57548.1 hypothetical protein KDC22_14355 [Paenibacillus tritici]